jgi:GH25 family lysozyme M1 (1,4-beta-N-acetylmuramidase)
MVIFGIDAHNKYQNGLSIAQVAREGYSGLIVKATQGATGYTAPGAFDTWIRRAREAGIVPGAYHWLTSAPASAQLDHYLRRLDTVGGPQGMLCAVDVEDTSSPLSYATVRDFVHGFAGRTGGHPLLLYTGAWWWKPRGWNGASLTPYLWASRYVSGSGYGSSLYAKVPASWWTPGYGGWARATLLQYSSSARVAGQTVDVNAFEGTMDDLRRLTSPSTTSGDTMDQNDRLIAETGNPGRTVGDHFGDMQRLRNWLIGATGDGADVPPEGSPLAQLVEAAARPAGTVALAPEDRVAIAADVASMIAPQLRGVSQLVERLGAAGDTLGVLNDPKPEKDKEIIVGEK